MKRLMSAGLLAVAMTGAAGCLVKQTTHTIHLSPEGTVDWVVIEREIRSDERDPAARAREERDYLAAARLGTHPVAEAFALLGPTEVQTQVYRDERPFMVVTRARFERLDWVGQRVLDRTGVPGESRFETVPGGVKWTFVAGPEPSEEESSHEQGRGGGGHRRADEAGALGALVEDAVAYRIVLTSGRFVDAVGFTIVDGGSAAVLEEQEDGGEEPDRIALSLTWTTRRE